MRIRLEVDNSRLIALREAIGAKSILLEIPEATTIQDLLVRLETTFGAAFQKASGQALYERILTRYCVLVNRKALWLPQQLDRTLTDGDEVAIFLPSGGG